MEDLLAGECSVVPVKLTDFTRCVDKKEVRNELGFVCFQLLLFSVREEKK